MLGKWDQSLGFSEFSLNLKETLIVSGGGLTAIWDITLTMIELWGLPLFIGCIPWALVTGWVGYNWALKFQQNRQSKLRKIVNYK